MGGRNSALYIYKIVTSIFLLVIAGMTVNQFSMASAQSLVPGIHGMSIVDGVKFTWVIVSSDREISVNLRYLGNTSTPPITIVATALTGTSQNNNNNNNSMTQSGLETGLDVSSQNTIGGSQVLNAGWISPNSLVIKIEGNSSLYNADLITVVASPFTGG
jgi:hypothetical protein